MVIQAQTEIRETISDIPDRFAGLELESVDSIRRLKKDSNFKKIKEDDYCFQIVKADDNRMTVIITRFKKEMLSVVAKKMTYTAFVNSRLGIKLKEDYKLHYSREQFSVN